MIQEIITLLAVSTALFYVGHKIWKQWFSKTSNCDGCAMSQLKSDSIRKEY